MNETITDDESSSNTDSTTTNSGRKKRRRRSIDHDNVDKTYCVAIKPPPPTPAPTLGPGVMVPVVPVYTKDSLNLTLQTVFSQCRFWNPENETWEGDGCYVSLDIL